VFVNKVFGYKGKILIKNLYQLKGYKVTELRNDFPNKWCTKLTGCWKIKRHWHSQNSDVMKLPRLW